MEGMDTFTFRLPCGVAGEKEKLHREVELTHLTGRVEELLARGREQEHDARVTLLLNRCLKRLGTVEPVTPDTVRRLAAADRRFLLLKLRELTFGDRVQATTQCPWPGCEEKTDINFSSKDIETQTPGMAAQEEWDMQVFCPGCGREFSLRFNPATFFFSQLRTGLDLLYREVHFLAFHYHWSEQEIMDLSREKRHNYIEILADEIERMNDGEDLSPPVPGFGNGTRLFIPDSRVDPAAGGDEGKKEGRKVRRKEGKKEKKKQGSGEAGKRGNEDRISSSKAPVMHTLPGIEIEHFRSQVDGPHAEGKIESRHIESNEPPPGIEIERSNFQVDESHAESKIEPRRIESNEPPPGIEIERSNFQVDEPHTESKIEPRHVESNEPPPGIKPELQTESRRQLFSNNYRLPGLNVAGQGDKNVPTRSGSPGFHFSGEHVGIPGVSEVCVAFPSLECEDTGNPPVQETGAGNTGLQEGNSGAAVISHQNPEKLLPDSGILKESDGTVHNPSPGSDGIQSPGISGHKGIGTRLIRAARVVEDTGEVMDIEEEKEDEAAADQIPGSSRLPQPSRTSQYLKNPGAPPAFWERSYLGHVHLRTLR
jgi:hypothetical protein